MATLLNSSRVDLCSNLPAGLYNLRMELTTLVKLCTCTDSRLQLTFRLACTASEAIRQANFSER